uniref:Ankyrin repeat protein n=1 Tax=viral metagenome TaxID=1070528 RepID=A0A6C0AET2_9ZZZZ
MISIKRLNTDKYSWLKNSNFYKNIDNFDEDIYLEYCSKYTKDIKKYLRVINLWGVTYFPKEFIDLFYKTKPLKEISELFESTQDLLYEFLMESLFADDIFYWAVKRNQLSFLKNLYDCGLEINCVLRINNLEIFNFLYEMGFKIDKYMMIAAFYKDIEILKYVHELFEKPHFGFYIDKNKIPSENFFYIKKFAAYNILKERYTRLRIRCGEMEKDVYLSGTFLKGETFFEEKVEKIGWYVFRNGKYVYT